MPFQTFFVHECPICGRQLQVRVEYLGSNVACPHCHGAFHLGAREPTKAHDPNSLLERAEHLLASAGQPSDAGGLRLAATRTLLRSAAVDRQGVENDHRAGRHEAPGGPLGRDHFGR